MGEHYPDASESVLAWCQKCGCTTKHAISGHKMTHCLEHVAPEETKTQRRRREKREHERHNPKLFE